MKDMWFVLFFQKFDLSLFQILLVGGLLSCNRPEQQSSQKSIASHELGIFMCKHVSLCGYVVNATDKFVVVSANTGDLGARRAHKSNQTIVVNGEKIDGQDIFNIDPGEDTRDSKLNLRDVDIDFVYLNGAWKKIGSWCTKLVTLSDGSTGQRWCSDARR
jgi:hypothetical protein